MQKLKKWSILTSAVMNSSSFQLLPLNQESLPYLFDCAQLCRWEYLHLFVSLHILCCWDHTYLLCLVKLFRRPSELSSGGDWVAMVSHQVRQFGSHSDDFSRTLIGSCSVFLAHRPWEHMVKTLCKHIECCKWLVLLWWKKGLTPRNTENWSYLLQDEH